MNHPFFEFWEDVAKKLLALGQEPDKVNLFFVPDAEQADVLLAAIRTSITLPVLAVEFFDEDYSDNSGRFIELSSGFVVLVQSEKKLKGHDDNRRVIYEVAKPAAEQILAYMMKLSDRDELRFDGKIASVSQSGTGNWVGPVHNDLYGWRYEFKIRIPRAPACFNPAYWKP